MSIIYQTTVVAMGAETTAFQEENMVIFFGENAPDTLKEYCYIIQMNPTFSPILPGQMFHIGPHPFLITAVGHVAEKNLVGLGHITLSFTGATTAEMPGTIYLESAPIPTISLGTALSIQK